MATCQICGKKDHAKFTVIGKNKHHFGFHWDCIDKMVRMKEKAKKTHEYLKAGEPAPNHEFILVFQNKHRPVWLQKCIEKIVNLIT